MNNLTVEYITQKLEVCNGEEHDYCADCELYNHCSDIYWAGECITVDAILENMVHYEYANR